METVSIPLVHVLTDTEALSSVHLAAQRLNSTTNFTMSKERRTEVKWTVKKVSSYLEGSPDPAATRRILTALKDFPLSEMTKVKLVNARATTKEAAFLADPEMPYDVTEEVAKAVERGMEGGEMEEQISSKKARK